MAAYEARGESNEWYTPFYIFEALGCRFDLDVASPPGVKTAVPADRVLTDGALETEWSGFVWMNPPFGHQNVKRAWLRKFFAHGDGIALTPDRTSAPWYREAWDKADAVLFLPKVKFYQPDQDRAGQFVRGEGPGTGTTLWATGPLALAALRRAARLGLGILAIPERIAVVGATVGPLPRESASFDREVTMLDQWLRGQFLTIQPDPASGEAEPASREARNERP